MTLPIKLLEAFLMHLDAQSDCSMWHKQLKEMRIRSLPIDDDHDKRAFKKQHWRKHFLRKLVVNKKYFYSPLYSNNQQNNLSTRTF